MRLNEANVKTMKLNDESDRYALDVYTLINAPSYEGTPRIVLSVLACSLSLEHWDSVRCLTRSRLLSSAVVVHRAQFEELLRSLWRLHVATDLQISKLLADPTEEVDLNAANLHETEGMFLKLVAKVSHQAGGALNSFNSDSWKALNSYAHMGIHPLRRHEHGHPPDILESVLRNANGLAAAAGMQLAALSGSETLIVEMLKLSEKHASCMLPRL
jgi:hypothetical protein